MRHRTPEDIICGLKTIFAPRGEPQQSYSDDELFLRFAKMIKQLSRN